MSALACPIIQIAATDNSHTKEQEGPDDATLPSVRSGLDAAQHIEPGQQRVAQSSGVGCHTHRGGAAAVLHDGAHSGSAPRVSKSVSAATAHLCGVHIGVIRALAASYYTEPSDASQQHAALLAQAAVAAATQAERKSAAHAAGAEAHASWAEGLLLCNPSGRATLQRTLAQLTARLQSVTAEAADAQSRDALRKLVDHARELVVQCRTADAEFSGQSATPPNGVGGSGAKHATPASDVAGSGLRDSAMHNATTTPISRDGTRLANSQQHAAAPSTIAQQTQARASAHTSATQGILGPSTAAQHEQGPLGNIAVSAGVKTSATQPQGAHQDAAHSQASWQGAEVAQPNEYEILARCLAQAASQHKSASRAALTSRADSGAVAEQDAAHAPALRKTIPARGMRRPPGIGFRPVRVLLANRALAITPDDAPLIRPGGAEQRMQETGQRGAAAPQSMSAGTGVSPDTLAEPGGTVGEQHMRVNDRTAARERAQIPDWLASTHHAAGEGPAQLRGQASTGA